MDLTKDCRHLYQIRKQRTGKLIIEIKKCIKCGLSKVPEFVSYRENIHYDIQALVLAYTGALSMTFIHIYHYINGNLI